MVPRGGSTPQAAACGIDIRTREWLVAHAHRCESPWGDFAAWIALEILAANLDEPSFVRSRWRAIAVAWLGQGLTSPLDQRPMARHPEYPV